MPPMPETTTLIRYDVADCLGNNKAGNCAGEPEVKRGRCAAYLMDKAYLAETLKRKLGGEKP